MNILVQWATYLNAVPNVIWAALIAFSSAVCASLLTVGGVLLQARNSRALQIATLQHDAKQRDREREMSVRREIYIPAADAVSRMQNNLLKLANLDVPDQEINETYTDSAAVLGRVQVVGQNALVQAISAYLLAYGEAYLELYFERAPLTLVKTQLNVLLQNVDRAVADQTRWANAMEQANVDGNRAPELWRVLNGNFKFASDQYANYVSARDLKTNELQDQQIELMAHAIEKLQSLATLIPPMLLAAREELELAIDRGEYLRLLASAQERASKLNNELIERAKKLIVRTREA